MAAPNTTDVRRAGQGRSPIRAEHSQRASRAPSSRMSRQLSRVRIKEIRAALRQMCCVDQHVRIVLSGALLCAQKSDQRVASLIERCKAKKKTTTCAHGAALRSIVKEVGWPALTVLGAQACRDAFDLILHDRSIDFQKRCLELMKSHQRRDVYPFHVAYLWDRTEIRQKRKQIFGTHTVRK